jgi:glycosyltransferase involved in cell wall biosynthesis
MKGKNIILAVTNELTYDRRMFRICSALAEAGANVILVGRKLKHSTAFALQSFEGIRLRCWFTKGFFFYAEYNIRLFFFLWRSKFDIACACDLDTAPAVRLASWIMMKRTVYDAHEYFSEVPELKDRPAVKTIWNWIGKLTIPGFDARYTVGQELATLMGMKYGVHFDVIRNIAPVYVNDSASTTKETGEKVLLYQGALNVGRGLEACVEAMVHLPDWQFWLAGEGDITQKLKMLSKEKRVGESIRFLGWVMPDDLPQLMRKARLSINLREAGSLNDFYSLPNKFFDAIHAGLPSINMNYPEYTAICKKYPCAALIDEVSVEKIVDTVHHIDSDEVHYERMVAACHEAAKEFTWENESKKLLEIYERLR